MEYKETICITDTLIRQFANLIGDKNPIHLDDEYASKTLFKKRIAHGMLISSYFSKIIAHSYPGEGSIYVNQSLQFLKPCYVNDLLTYVITLIKQDKSKFFLKTEIFNNNNELILTGEALIINKNKNE